MSALQRALRRECDDTDALLRHLGLDPKRCRTEGGWLNVPRIKTLLAEQPKPAVRAEKLYDAIKVVLLHHRLSYTEGEDAEAFPLVDMLCPPGSRDISKGRDEITLICDAIYNDEAVRAAISGEQP